MAKLKVLFVSAEVTPFSKVGGLADVAGSLPKALLKNDVDVRIVTPRYRNIDANMDIVTDFAVNMNGIRHTCIVRRGNIKTKVLDSDKNLPVYFIDNYHYYDRDGIYCFWDDGERFAFFDKAVLEMLPKIDFKPDVIHCNDWQTGPITLLLKDRYKNDEFYKNISTVFTVHNLQYQGNFNKSLIKSFDLDEQKYFNVDYTEFYGAFGFMKIGLKFADVINAVSLTYSKQIQTSEYGENLEGLINSRKDTVFGIVNGIDKDEWNCKTDKDIFKNFDLDSVVSGKSVNKYKLQFDLDLPLETDTPIISMISRLVDQKGFDILIPIIENLLSKDIQFILLGQGNPYYEGIFKNLESKYPKKVRTFIKFDTNLAKKIYSGSDMFLMPSKFEPCGLGQMMAMSYATIPIVRKTGGLADTVIDGKTGFVFEKYSSDELKNAINRAISIYFDKQKWNKMLKNAIMEDFSWEKSSKEYIKIYKKAINLKNNI